MNAVPAPRTRSSRVDEASWIEAALSLLADGGIAAVRVEPLALKLGVTKGAFYSRYPTRDALHVAMLQYWRREKTSELIETLSVEESAAERLQRLLMFPFRRPDVQERARLEMAIRIWAHGDPRAAATMDEIDGQRLKHLQALLIANGVAPEDAEARAFVMYGYLIVEGSLPGKRSESVQQACRRFLSSGISQ